MHRNGYKGRKFGRERDQRKALLNGLAISLIEHGSISTTEPKAKDLRPYVEKLITKAKVNSLHSRRQIIDSIHNIEMAHKLIDEIAPKINRQSGYLRITKLSNRRGDNASMAKISFVDDISKSSAPEKVEKKVTTKSTEKTKSTTVNSTKSTKKESQ